MSGFAGATALAVGQSGGASALAVGQSGGAPAAGGLLAVVVTLLVATAFVAVTLHLAAVFFLGDVASQRAVLAAPVVPVTVWLLQQWGPEVIVPMVLLGDFLAIRYSYDLPVRAAIALTALHFAFTVALLVPLNNIFGFVG